MAPLERLGADQLREVVEAFRDALVAHKEGINRLNVYPVPDGDTGTNMSLTLDSVVAGLTEADRDLATTCKAVSHGALMGARGNSGVILSAILRGVATTFAASADDDGLDGPGYAAALAAGAEGAYGSVGKPVEGTILTVVREAAGAATKRSTSDATLVDVVEAAKQSGADALASTPDLLPVLKEAGVVDAGGAGFLLFLDATLHVIDGRPLPEPVEVAAPNLVTFSSVDDAHAHGDGISDLRYEVMYFLEAPDDTITAFKDVWAGIGDSIVVVGGDGLWNCHIHTDDIGSSIEAALDVGRPRNIRVTDLLEQVEEERWVREAEPQAPPARPAVTTAVVAVATGAGIERIFHSLGVQAIVAGGQSMNPSTAQLLDAVESVNAEQVVILPNNKNIIPVAEQVDDLATRAVRVVPTRGIAEGFAALLAYDPDADVDDNVDSMTDAAASVVAGEVTRAVRASTCDAGPIAEGDFIGIARDGIRAIDATLAGATIGLLDALVGEDHEIVTLIEGDGAGAAETRRVSEWMAEHRPDVQVEIHHGGQPLYPYLIGVE
jgi:DAK2 domain fusion protein YloV